MAAHDLLIALNFTKVNQEFLNKLQRSIDVLVQDLHMLNYVLKLSSLGT